MKQLSDDRLEWVAEISRRSAPVGKPPIVEQIPKRKIAWAATRAPPNAGAVTFQDLGGRTLVHLSLEYEPEGLVEKVGDKLNVVENRAKGDVERFKKFVESEGYATGAWRGSVNPGGMAGKPSVDDADDSRGDKGKAGVSGKAVAAGLGAAAAAAAATASGVGRCRKEQRGPRRHLWSGSNPSRLRRPRFRPTSRHATAPDEAAPPRVISYEEASEIVENAQNLPQNERDNP